MLAGLVATRAVAAFGVGKQWLSGLSPLLGRGLEDVAVGRLAQLVDTVLRVEDLPLVGIGHHQTHLFLLDHVVRTRLLQDGLLGGRAGFLDFSGPACGRHLLPRIGHDISVVPLYLGVVAEALLKFFGRLSDV